MNPSRAEEFRTAIQGNRTQILDETKQVLLEILYKRIPEKLFLAGVPDKIVAYSGGVLRELIRIANECCRLARVEILKKERRNESVEQLQIDDALFGKALENLRNGMAITLSKNDREILTVTYRNHKPDDPKDQTFLDLLHNTSAIEYRNAQSWYDVHPLIVEQLEQEGLLP